MTYIVTAKNCQETFDLLEREDVDWMIDREDMDEVHLEFDSSGEALYVAELLMGEGLAIEKETE